MQAKLDEIKKLSCTRLLVDFRDVISIGSLGVSFILDAWKSVVREPGGRFVLTAANPRVRRVLDLTRISSIVPLAPDLASGLVILGVEATVASPAFSNCVSAGRDYQQAPGALSQLSPCGLPEARLSRLSGS